jgi:serine/threonine protein phosphatase PrpC|tara:strand:- start:546 stop:734 length:189 start_codon:yes stop_codon:yes gene_type:complete
LVKAFLEYDEMVGKEDFAYDTGTTTNVILLTSTHIYCANAGDSRSAMSKSKKAIGLSEDHKP